MKQYFLLYWKLNKLEFGNPMHNAQLRRAAAKGFGGDRKAPEKRRATCFDLNLALSVKQL